MSEGEVLEGKLEESEDVTFEDYIKVWITRLQLHLKWLQN